MIDRNAIHITYAVSTKSWSIKTSNIMFHDVAGITVRSLNEELVN